MADGETVPLFPLNTVLMPGGVLSLRIFEPRYLDMVSRCMKNDGPFGVVLIREGGEVGPAASFHDTGTLARITDWRRLDDGLLGIAATGGARFAVVESWVERDQLAMAAVRRLPDEPAMPLPDEHAGLAELLRRLRDAAGPPHANIPPRWSDAAWVGHRLVELLPLQLSQKQYFLQLDDPLTRLDRLRALIDEGELDTGT